MKDKDCTLVLSTYDGGEDLWEGFFKALITQWAGFNMPVVMNTETKSYSFPGINIKVINSGDSSKSKVWGRRLINTLKQVETEYILLFLEDFWLDAPVDTVHFEKCLQWMRENQDVANISFQRTHGENIKDNRFERFERRPKKGEYRMNCQVGLWRRRKLIEFIRPHENPWEWEKYGSIRSRRYGDSLYSLIDGAPKVFSYDLGGVVYKGRWNKKAVVPLVEKYNLSIDFSQRGFHEDWKKSNHKRERNIFRGIKNRYHIFRSLI